MADVVPPEKRSRMMAGIRSKDTKPELLIRKGLHHYGFRYRLHDRRLPGTPDLVLSKYQAVIFVHGCFWHMHGCPLFRWPSSRVDFWREKLSTNHRNDCANADLLRAAGWRVLVVWECALKGPGRRDLVPVVEEIVRWLTTPAVLDGVIEGQGGSSIVDQRG